MVQWEGVPIGDRTLFARHGPDKTIRLLRGRRRGVSSCQIPDKYYRRDHCADEQGYAGDRAIYHQLWE